jgi:hypothetical protein
MLIQKKKKKKKNKSYVNIRTRNIFQALWSHSEIHDPHLSTVEECEKAMALMGGAGDDDSGRWKQRFRAAKDKDKLQ